MSSVNMVVMSGRLGGDPEERKTSTGKLMVRFSLCNSRWDTKNQEEIADWYSVTVFDKEAERCMKVLSKGALVLVEGRIQIAEWTGQDGRKMSKPDITGNRVTVLSFPRRDSQGASTGEGVPATPSPVAGGEAPGDHHAPSKPRAHEPSRRSGSRMRDLEDAIPF